MNPKAIQITKPPKHHFFGFHDLPAWNFKDDKILCLEVDEIRRPPLPKEFAGVGYVSNDSKFIKLGSTCAFNYPQGARMQWIGDTNDFIVNNQFYNSWGCDIYDTDCNKLIDRFPFSCYCLHKNGNDTFSINYSRLFRLGVYGYPGIEDFTKNVTLPKDDGIIIGDLVKKSSKILISISDVANFPNKLSHMPYVHHYITHLVFNPSQTRLAFLHRYSLSDGGEITRLLTIKTDGSDLRCLASGFLSHFDWKDDNSIFIFGRANSPLDAMRSSHILSMPIISDLARSGKQVIKKIIGKSSSINSGFMLIKDATFPEVSKVAINKLTEDGHPMFCPLNRDWIINDTYPNAYGTRTLMLYQFSKNERIDLGTFKMINEKPNMNNIGSCFLGVDEQIINSIGSENLAFTRSGLHCDLHPRWDRQGKKIAFDSIHEGIRQIYMVDVEDIIKAS